MGVFVNWRQSWSSGCDGLMMGFVMMWMTKSFFPCCIWRVGKIIIALHLSGVFWVFSPSDKEEGNKTKMLLVEIPRNTCLIKALTSPRLGSSKPLEKISQLEFPANSGPAVPWAGTRKGYALFRRSCAFLDRGISLLVLSINWWHHIAEKYKNWERESEDVQECRFPV